MSFWNNRKKYTLLVEDANEGSNSRYSNKFIKKSEFSKSIDSKTKSTGRLSQSLNNLSDDNHDSKEPPPIPPRRPSKPISLSQSQSLRHPQVSQINSQRFRNSFSVQSTRIPEPRARIPDSPLQYPPASLLPVLHRNAMLRNSQYVQPETILWIPIGNNQGGTATSTGRNGAMSCQFMGPRELFNLFQSAGEEQNMSMSMSHNEAWELPPTYDEALEMELPVQPAPLEQLKQRFIRETSV